MARAKKKTHVIQDSTGRHSTTLLSASPIPMFGCHTRLFVMILCSAWACFSHGLRIPKRRYLPMSPGEHPGDHLKCVSMSTALITSRSWYAAVLGPNQRVAIEDEHLVEQVNRLETFVQANVQTDVPDEAERYYYLWMPPEARDQPRAEQEQDGYVHSEPLFIAATTLDRHRNCMMLNLLVQSPFWSPEQVSSTHLRSSLQAKAASFNKTCTLDMTDLFRLDVRYKLEWSGWVHNADDD